MATGAASTVLAAWLSTLESSMTVPMSRASTSAGEAERLNPSNPSAISLEPPLLSIAAPMGSMQAKRTITGISMLS